LFFQFAIFYEISSVLCLVLVIILPIIFVQGDTKKREFWKTPKFEEIQEKKLLTEIEPLQLAF